MIPSRYHRTIIRWLHDDIARASRSRVAFVRQSGSFLFPSYCLRESKYARYHRWSYEVITMSRFDKMPFRWPYEGQNGHTKSIRKWTAFANTLVNFFCMPKFCLCSRSCCWRLENTTGGHTMGKDSFVNGPMFSRLNIFIFVCPSAFKFGTVWRQHKKNVIQRGARPNLYAVLYHTHLLKIIMIKIPMRFCRSRWRCSYNFIGTKQGSVHTCSLPPRYSVPW